MSDRKAGHINDPSTIHFFIARAETLDEWRRLNRMAHDRLEAAIEKAQKEGIDMDLDENISNLNSFATLSHEIVEMKSLAEKMLGLKPR